MKRLLQRMLAALALVLAVPAFAQDTLKLAIGQRGNWDTSVSEVGTRLGIFKKHNLVLEILYTQGGGETQQAVISGSVDIGVAAGVMGVMSAFSKGAPVRVIGAETTGAQDLFWYVPANSPVKSLKDTDGQDDRVFDQRLVDERNRHGVRQAVRPESEAGRNRWAVVDADAGDVRPGRRRLVGAAVRPRPARRQQDPHHRKRQ